MFPGRDLYSIDLNPAEHVIPADTGCTVNDLYDLYTYMIYMICMIYISDIIYIYMIYMIYMICERCGNFRISAARSARLFAEANVRLLRKHEGLRATFHLG